MTLRFFDNAEVRAALARPDAMSRLADILASPVVVPLRLTATGPQGTDLLVMPAVAERYAGVKILSVVEGNAARDRPVIGGLFVLLDARTGDTLATMDAAELTGWRTAAVSALVSRSLSRPESTRLTIIGTGHLAPYLAQAHSSVRPIGFVGVWGRCPAKTEACCAEIRKRLPDITVAPMDDLAEAVAAGDIVSAATRATEPLIAGQWIAPGTHIDLVGGYRPDMREIDDDGIARASIYVDSIEGALAEAGDLISPIERGIIARGDIRGDLSALLAGSARMDAAEITLFKSVGSALSDLAAASLVWDSA